MKDKTFMAIKLMCPICKKLDFHHFEEQVEYDNRLIENTCNKILNMVEQKKQIVSVNQ